METEKLEENKDDAEVFGRLDEIVKSIDDENIEIEEAIKLLEEAVEIGSNICDKTVLQTQDAGRYESGQEH